MQDFFQFAGLGRPTYEMAQGVLYGGYPLYPLRPKGGMWAPTGA